MRPALPLRARSEIGWFEIGWFEIGWFEVDRFEIDRLEIVRAHVGTNLRPRHVTVASRRHDPEVRMPRLFALTAMVLLAIGALASPASAATITVTPAAVTTSGSVTVSGDVLVNGSPGCTAGDDVTLSSDAFAGISEFAGVGAVMTPVDATGHFSAAVTLQPGVAAGVYTITGRCGGGNLGVSATLTVTGLPTTGSSLGPLSTTEALALALLLCALGVVLARVGRRRIVVADSAGSNAPAR